MLIELFFFSDDEMGSLPMTPPHIRSMAERDARAMEAATRAMEEATKRIEDAGKNSNTSTPSHPMGPLGPMNRPPHFPLHHPLPMPAQMDRHILPGHIEREMFDRENERRNNAERDREERVSERLGEREALKERDQRSEENTIIKSEEPPAKKHDRGDRDNSERHPPLMNISPVPGMPSTHIKINSRGSYIDIIMLHSYRHAHNINILTVTSTPEILLEPFDYIEMKDLDSPCEETYLQDFLVILKRTLQNY